MPLCPAGGSGVRRGHPVSRGPEVVSGGGAVGVGDGGVCFGAAGSPDGPGPSWDWPTGEQQQPPPPPLPRPYPPPARHRPAAPSTTPTRPRPNKPKREADSAAAVPSPGASRSLAQRATPALLLSCRRSRPWATASALAHFPRPHLLRHGSRVFRAMTTSGPWRCVPVPHLLRGRSSTDRCAGSAEGWAAGPAPSAPMHPLSGACLPVPGRSLTLWIPGNKRRGDPGCPNSPRTREEGLGWGEPCRLRAGIHAPRCTFPTPTPSPAPQPPCPHPTPRPHSPLRPRPPPRAEGSQGPLLLTPSQPPERSVGSLFAGVAGRG